MYVRVVLFPRDQYACLQAARCSIALLFPRVHGRQKTTRVNTKGAARVARRHRRASAGVEQRSAQRELVRRATLRGASVPRHRCGTAQRAAHGKHGARGRGQRAGRVWLRANARARILGLDAPWRPAWARWFYRPAARVSDAPAANGGAHDARRRLRGGKSAGGSDSRESARHARQAHRATLIRTAVALKEARVRYRTDRECASFAAPSIVRWCRCARRRARFSVDDKRIADGRGWRKGGECTVTLALIAYLACNCASKLVFVRLVYSAAGALVYRLRGRARMGRFASVRGSLPADGAWLLCLQKFLGCAALAGMRSVSGVVGRGCVGLGRGLDGGGLRSGDRYGGGSERGEERPCKGQLFVKERRRGSEQRDRRHVDTTALLPRRHRRSRCRQLCQRRRGRLLKGATDARNRSAKARKGARRRRRGRRRSLRQRRSGSGNSDRSRRHRVGRRKLHDVA